MVPILLVLLLALILFGAGFALKVLWWIALAVLATMPRCGASTPSAMVRWPASVPARASAISAPASAIR
ncbi:hydrophobic protein [Streptomyces canarius]